VPTLERKHAAILLRRGADDFLWDCGEGAQLGLLAAKVSPIKISRVFISHWHADHFAGLLPLIETMHMEQRKEPLHIYGPEAARFVDALLELSYWGVGFQLRTTEVPLDSTEVIFTAPDYSISSIPVKHNIPAVGYMLQEKSHWKIDVRKAAKLGLQPGPLMSKLHANGEVRANGRTIRLSDIAAETAGRKIAYSGDTLAYEPFFRAIAGADLLIHDGTFVEPLPERSHADVEEAARLAVKYGIKRLVFTHVSRRYGDTLAMLKSAKKAFRGAVVANDGLHLQL